MKRCPWLAGGMAGLGGDPRLQLGGQDMPQPPRVMVWVLGSMRVPSCGAEPPGASMTMVGSLARAAGWQGWGAQHMVQDRQSQGVGGALWGPRTPLVWGTAWGASPGDDAVLGGSPVPPHLLGGGVSGWAQGLCCRASQGPSLQQPPPDHIVVLGGSGQAATGLSNPSSRRCPADAGGSFSHYLVPGDPPSPGLSPSKGHRENAR